MKVLTAIDFDGKFYSPLNFLRKNSIFLFKFLFMVLPSKQQLQKVGNKKRKSRFVTEKQSKENCFNNIKAVKSVFLLW